MNGDQVYLDNAATTPCDPRVVEVMNPFWGTEFGNPSSTHRMGQSARVHLERARQRLLACLGQDVGTIIFTSGATESNNMAVLSCLRSTQMARAKQKVLYLSTEHKSVIEPLHFWGSVLGIDVERILVDGKGRLDFDCFRRQLDETVGAVIVQLANSETGVIQDVAQVADWSHRFGALCASDVTQAVGKVDVNLRDLSVDMATFNGHKIHGPRGVGALYVRNGVLLEPIIRGGGQERGVRSGTEPLPQIMGMIAAIELATAARIQTQLRLAQLRDALWDGLRTLGQIRWNGVGAPMLPTHLNVTLEGVNAQELILRTHRIAFSAGSACNARAQQPSPVLLEMGLSSAEAECSMRFSFGLQNTEDDLEQALQALLCEVPNIRSNRA